MRKYLKDLSFEELKDVLKKNDELFNKAQEKAVDDAYYWLGEYLDDARRLKNVDYSIGFNRGDYFTIKDMTSDVLDWIKGVSEDYGVFQDDVVRDAERCNEMYEFLQYGSDEDTFEGKSEDEVYDEYEELKKDIAGRICDRLVREISYWYLTPDDQLASDFADFIDEFFIDDYDSTIVDMDTGELIDLEDFEDDERDWMDPDQLKLPGFED